jgi:lytic murein transglycosylase
MHAGPDASPAYTAAFQTAAVRSSMTCFRWAKPLLLIACAGLAVWPAWGQSDGDFSRCTDALRRELPAHPEVRADTFDAYTRRAQDLRPVIDAATQSQPEFKLAVWDYVVRLADEQRAIDGRQILQREAEVLPAIERRHGVDAATVAAVFGVETDYGRVPGKYPVIDATLSRACLNLDSKERKSHFFAALRLVQDGIVKPEEFRGSWAGAFGMTQFMPGTFVRYMDAADGSGRVDIISNVGDALSTTARFLVGLGWASGLPWGMEVEAPKAVIAQWNALERDHGCVAGTTAGKCRSVEQWASLGVKRIDKAGGGAVLPPAARAALFAPAGADGPVWLVTRNFHALWGYNRADAYALAIGLLSDALRGDPPMQAQWPTDDAAIGRIEFRELQSLLLMRGYGDVTPDGYDGPKTREAIKAEERRRGLPETGRAGAKMLALLRSDSRPASDAASGPR